MNFHTEFVTAAQNKLSAHDAVVKAEAVAAAQAAIDTQNQAPQWSDYSNTWGIDNPGGGFTGGNSGSGGSDGGRPGGGGVIPGGGSNPGGGCVTDNGMGGTMPCP